MSQPAISVVIPAFNCEGFIATTLRGVCAQTFHDWECIIIDDGSTDGTPVLLAQWAREDRRFRIIRQENRGTCAARNRGLGLSNRDAKYITFLDPGDLWAPDALVSLYQPAEAAPDMAGAHGLAGFLDENGATHPNGEFTDHGRRRMGVGRNGRMRPWHPDEPTSFRTLLSYNTVWPSSVLLTRRAFYEKTGLFDPSIGLVEDWDMLLRMTRFGDFQFVDKVVTFCRRPGGSLSLQSSGAAMEKVRELQTKTFNSRENNAAHREIARQVWREMQIQCMRGKWDRIRRGAAAGKILDAGKTFGRMYVEIHRYLRGYPTARGL